MTVKEKIIGLVEEKLQEEDFQDCFIVEVNHNNTKLEVFVDSDSFISFEKCRKISRYLEKVIDEKGWMGQKYTLEVSSPGISRPLVFKRQYSKNIGRQFEVKLKPEGKHTGILVSVTDEKITLEEKVRVKEGKKKVNKVLSHEILFENIDKAVIKPAFK